MIKKPAPLLSSLLIFFLILLSGFHLLFALRTNAYFSLDDFPILNYFQNHSLADMLIRFLTQGDLWGFKKIIGYLNLKLLFTFFKVNPYAYIINNHLIHTLNLILLFLILKRIRRDPLKAFFVTILTNKIYLFYFSNIHEYLVTFFILLSVFSFQKFSKKPYLSLAFFILGLLTKEIAFITPFILLSLTIAKKKKRYFKRLIPFFVVSIIFLTYQFLINQNRLGHSGDHPYALGLSIKTLFNNLNFYFPYWLLALSLLIPLFLKKVKSLPFLAVFFLSLLPVLFLANRQEAYYFYLPNFVLAFYLDILLPRFTLAAPRIFIYLIVFAFLGGREVLPKIARQDFPNWQKVSIENVLKHVEDSLQDLPEETTISLTNIHLERDAKLMLGSDTLNLFISPDLASTYQFKYDQEQQLINVNKTSSN